MRNDEADVIGSEQLVQRFVDNELSSAERVQLLMRLGRDEALRGRLIELEQIAAGADRLSRPAVPAGFVPCVMERTAPPRSLGQRLRETLWTPRALQWNLASALGTVCVALLIAGAAVTLDRAGQPASISIPVVTPAAPSTRVLVRLVMLQPGAQTVGVAGDFNGWDPLQTPLFPTTGGAWIVTLPLEPGRYEYMFVVDGTQWVVDPFAEEQQDDGFGLRNGVLDVRSTVESSL